MSRGRICDQCGTTLVVDKHGEDDGGESAAWLTLTAGDGSQFDLCTRACTIELLNDPEFIAATDAHAEVIVGVARAIRGDEDDD